MDILIVEDNKELADLLCDFLRAENYTVSAVQTAEKALLLYERYGARLVVLDIMLPDKDGFYVLEKIRRSSNTPVLIVSAKTEKDDKLNGLNLGADDYIEKPYDIDIMLAKISGIFKRRYALDEITDGNIRINKASRAVYKNEKELEMTAKEFELLLLLMENKGRALSKEYIFEQVWGSDSFSEQQTLTVHIKWLRQKIAIRNLLIFLIPQAKWLCKSRLYLLQELILLSHCFLRFLYHRGEQHAPMLCQALTQSFVAYFVFQKALDGQIPIGSEQWNPPLCFHRKIHQALVMASVLHFLPIFF